MREKMKRLFSFLVTSLTLLKFVVITSATAVSEINKTRKKDRNNVVRKHLGNVVRTACRFETGPKYECY